MAADSKQLRQVSSQIVGDEIAYYTASNSPHLQGYEILHIRQLTSYISPKIRGNISLLEVLSGSNPGQVGDSNQASAYNDLVSPQNFGKLFLKQEDVYTLGRDPALGFTGRAQYITALTSGTFGFNITGSISSKANLDTRNRFETYVSHIIEKRDLGQSHEYDDSSPFYEPDIVENDPTIILKKDPEALVLPASLVLAATPASLDGVIEPLTIRSIVDGSSIELPYVIKSIKGSLANIDEKRNSILFEDSVDLRQTSQSFSTAPFLDSVSSFGDIDQPGSFSDAQENVFPFADTSDIEQETAPISDSQIVSTLISGFVSSSVAYRTPDTAYLPTYRVVSRHGFVFSQNDNFGYDSIAFGGLLK